MTEFVDRMRSLLGGAIPEHPKGLSPHQPAEALIERVLDEIEAKRAAERNWWSVRTTFSDLPAFNELMQKEPDFVAVAAVAAIISGSKLRSGSTSNYWREDARQKLASQILRRALPFTEDQIVTLLDDASQRRHLEHETPLAALLGATERYCDGRPPPPRLRAALERLLEHLRDLSRREGANKAKVKFSSRINGIIEPSAIEAIRIPEGEWTTQVLKWVSDQGDLELPWLELLAHAATAADKSKPTAKWIAAAAPLVEGIGKEPVALQTSIWMDQLTPNPAQPDPSLNVLKGLIWCARLLPPDLIVGPVGRFSETCFRKVPMIGARSTLLGNACIAALSSMAEEEAATAELVRLKSRLKYASAKALIERKLTEIAATRGVAVSDLEEGALPTYGLDGAGRLSSVFGDVSATISTSAHGVSLEWTDLHGKVRSGPSASAKAEFSGELRALKQKVKDLAAIFAGQVALIEDSWISGSQWPIPVWRQRFFDHPLRSAIVRSLIWRIESSGVSTSAMVSDNRWHDPEGNALDVSESATISLWHPLNSNVEETLAWRRHIVDLGFTQPIKQAHREVYVLTDAELRTGTYSNRFAAHVLRQHQFRALCQARGWSYQLQGQWDSFNIPTRRIERRDLIVEYHVDGIDNNDTGQSGVFLYLATDQVRFSRLSGERVELKDVPAILFSELMRDVDLFVAVCSVANDPTWVDGGPEGRYREYWTTQAFGDLGETAQSRRDLLAQIAPRLAIADRLRVDGNFLHVKGVRQEYRIHIGSSNIQILPGNRYLCIVRGADSKVEGQVRLPFAGDSMLAVILSKAFMLAADDRISDPSILAQL